ncbi:MAG TPA: hypothetical protein VLI44_04980, partial [Sporolactobacillaceae bacterium]|nr:hypothetical protein [Sporolactobacillaceae bacterium]
QVLVASVLAFHVIVFALLTIPESICSATWLGDLIWDQFSTPCPHAPAGDLTLRLIKIWTNHVVEIELPQFPDLAARFDWKFVMSLRSVEWRCASLAKPLLVDRVLVAESDPKKRERLLEIPTSLCGVLVESVNILHSSPSLPEAPDRACSTRIEEKGSRGRPTPAFQSIPRCRRELELLLLHREPTQQGNACIANCCLPGMNSFFEYSYCESTLRCWFERLHSVYMSLLVDLWELLSA